jgi:sigma-B regulation protein RsbU (phosphoserine phosphatase)
MVTAAAPVYEGNTFLGTVALDFTLDVLNDFIQHSKTQDIHQTHLFLLNQYDELLAHPTLIQSTDTAVKSADTAFPSPLQRQSQRVSQLPTDQIQAVDRYLVIRHPLKAAPWQLVLWVPKQEMVLAALAGTDWLFLALLPGLGLTLVVANQLTRKEFITPAHKLVEHIENEFQGNTTGSHNVPKSWQFWFEKVSQIFDENRDLLGAVINY